jgi:GNAT superfamily N-acetyltransferase
MRLRRELDHAELIDLFVEPGRIGHGHGKRLFGRAVEIARGWEISAIELDSDPNAEPFYRSRGMQRMDARPSPVDRTRLLPRMRLELS